MSSQSPTILGPTPPQTPVLPITHWRLSLPSPSSFPFALGINLLCLKHPGRLKCNPQCVSSTGSPQFYFLPLVFHTEGRKNGLWPWLSKRDMKKYPSWDLGNFEESTGKGWDTKEPLFISLQVLMLCQESSPMPSESKVFVPKKCNEHRFAWTETQ